MRAQLPETGSRLSVYIRARRHVPRKTCMAPLLYIINTSSSLKGWAEPLVELQRLSRAAIGRELCQSASQHSPTSSVLLFCSSPRGEGNGCFLRESAPLPQPATRHLSLTYSADRKLRGSCPSSAASPPVFMSALPVSLPVCVCVWSRCFSLPVVPQRGRQEEEERPVPGRRKP